MKNNVSLKFCVWSSRFALSLYEFISGQKTSGWTEMEFPNLKTFPLWNNQDVLQIFAFFQKNLYVKITHISSFSLSIFLTQVSLMTRSYITLTYKTKSRIYFLSPKPLDISLSIFQCTKYKKPGFKNFFHEL